MIYRPDSIISSLQAPLPSVVHNLHVYLRHIYTEENVLFIEDLVFGKEMDLFTTLDTKVNKKCLEVEQTVRTVANDLLFLSRLQYTFLTYSYRVF